MLKDERFDFTILENDIVRDTEKYNKLFSEDLY